MEEFLPDDEIAYNDQRDLFSADNVPEVDPDI